MQPDALLKAREVQAMLGICHASLYRRIAEGMLPKPVKLGRSSRWVLSDVLAAVEAAKGASNV
ncbi:AlpA family transcriptional regulator [Devosia sp.]|uniref:helix-turn-helix transcriptional regulator n=1 Tax=Devosia sp. TaxID=1871048 RepID=UPI001AC7A92B|nr:AlpA family phage regulatory protein [Devosia sp.]MBN9334913.1 AlpA family phage regulatory protein [Devosia sp.]